MKSSPLTRRQPMKWVSARNWWPKLRAKLKVEFERVGLTRCEACSGEFALSFAHAEKRRFITTPEQQQEVALLCHDHHAILERLPHAKMAEQIRLIIANRETPVRKIS
jgi:hypothetical protein